MIVAEQLSKRFGDHVALDAASFTVGPGEVVGLLGPNGAGKTTAMRILAGVFPPTSGRTMVAGIDLATAPIAARRRLGYAPERPALHPEMHVRGQLDFVANLRGAGSARAAVADVLDQMRLGELAARRIATLSKGMRQRVGLATALVGDPPVLLLDEPTAGLDPGQRSDTRRLIRRLAPDRAILVSSHELADVEAFCDRVVILHHGRVLADGPPAALAARIRARPTIRVEVRAPQDDVHRALAAIPGVGSVTVDTYGDDVVTCMVEPVTDDDLRPTIARHVHDAGWPLLTVSRIEPSLEDTFVRLVESAPRRGS